MIQNVSVMKIKKYNKKKDKLYRPMNIYTIYTLAKNSFYVDLGL